MSNFWQKFDSNICHFWLVPGIRHSAIYVILGFRQVRISVIVPSSRKLGMRIFWNRPIPEIRYPPKMAYINIGVLEHH